MERIKILHVGAGGVYENGDMVIINHNGKSVVFDMNKRKDRNGRETSAWEIIAEHARLECGIPTVDYLFVTHPDNDHIGDAENLEEAINKGRIVINKIITSPFKPESNPDFNEDVHPDYKAFRRIMQKIPCVYAYEDDVITIAYDFTVNVLNPSKEKDLTEANDAAIVLLINIASKTLLILSDIDYKTWDSMTYSAKKKIEDSKIDYCILPHHGSVGFFDESIDTAKGKEPEDLINYRALDVINPDTFILSAETDFPCGDSAGDNPPHYRVKKAVEHWIRQNGSKTKLYRTAVSGDITFSISGSSNTLYRNIRPYQGDID